MLEKFAKVDSVSKELIDGIIKSFSEGMGWVIVEADDQRCSRSFHLLFDSIANFLAKVKSTEEKVGLILEDYNQNFQFAAYVQYVPNANEDMPGNWVLAFTFDPDDLKDCPTIYKSSDNAYKDLTGDIAKHHYGFDFTSDSTTDPNSLLDMQRVMINQIIGAAARAIKGWVDENSISSEPISTEIKGKCILDAMVDSDGTKICSITPSGELKNIIKDDAAIENKKEREKSKKKK